MQRVISSVQRPRMALHTGLKTLFRLAQVEVLLAVIGIIVAIAGLCVAKAYLPCSYTVSDGVKIVYTIVYPAGPRVAVFGFGLFVAMLGVLSGSLGIGALGGYGGVTAARIATVRHQRLAVAHFIFCILVAVLDFIGIVILIVQSSTWYGYSFGIVPISWILTIIFFTHFVCSVISCGFTCNNWCCGGAGVEHRTEEKGGINYA